MFACWLFFALRAQALRCFGTLCRHQHTHPTGACVCLQVGLCLHHSRYFLFDCICLAGTWTGPWNPCTLATYWKQSLCFCLCEKKHIYIYFFKGTQDCYVSEIPSAEARYCCEPPPEHSATAAPSTQASQVQTMHDNANQCSFWVVQLKLLTCLTNY